jgi:hypothetical protein
MLRNIFNSVGPKTNIVSQKQKLEQQFQAQTRQAQAHIKHMKKSSISDNQFAAKLLLYSTCSQYALRVINTSPEQSGNPSAPTDFNSGMKHCFQEFQKKFKRLSDHFGIDIEDADSEVNTDNLAEHCDTYTFDTCVLKAILVYLSACLLFDEESRILHRIVIDTIHDIWVTFDETMPDYIIHNIVFQVYACVSALSALKASKTAEIKPEVLSRLKIDSNIRKITRSIQRSKAVMNIAFQDAVGAQLVEWFGINLKAETQHILSTKTETDYTKIMWVVSGLIFSFLACLVAYSLYSGQLGSFLEWFSSSKQAVLSRDDEDTLREFFSSKTFYRVISNQEVIEPFRPKLTQYAKDSEAWESSLALATMGITAAFVAASGALAASVAVLAGTATISSGVITGLFGMSTGGIASYTFRDKIAPLLVSCSKPDLRLASEILEATLNYENRTSHPNAMAAVAGVQIVVAVVVGFIWYWKSIRKVPTWQTVHRADGTNVPNPEEIPKLQDILGKVECTTVNISESINLCMAKLDEAVQRHFATNPQVELYRTR